MTRSMTAAGTALCAILFVTVQVDMSAQSKTAAKTPAKAAAAPTKATPPKALPARAAASKVSVAPIELGDPVTVSGCLEADGSKYVLTDMPGNQAPKGRSWKTGFITKKSKDVEVTGTSSTVKLRDHVGHRISMVGVKDGDTHFKARSVKQLAGTCS